jgi:hypothetical protein
MFSLSQWEDENRQTNLKANVIKMIRTNILEILLAYINCTVGFHCDTSIHEYGSL